MEVTTWAKVDGSNVHAWPSRESYNDGTKALCGELAEVSRVLKRGELCRSVRCETCTKMVKNGHVVRRQTA